QHRRKNFSRTFPALRAVCGTDRRDEEWRRGPAERRSSGLPRRNRADGSDARSTACRSGLNLRHLLLPLAALLAIAAWQHVHRPVAHDPGVLVADAPAQEDMDGRAFTLQKSIYSLKPWQSFRCLRAFCRAPTTAGIRKANSRPSISHSAGVACL